MEEEEPHCLQDARATAPEGEDAADHLANNCIMSIPNHSMTAPIYTMRGDIYSTTAGKHQSMPPGICHDGGSAFAAPYALLPAGALGMPHPTC